MVNQMVFKRYEFKYMMTRRQRDILLAVMEPYMELDEYGLTSIRNIYFDTPDFRLIRHSLERPVYKEKLRLRSYGRAKPSDNVYIELKKKYNAIVYKRRLSLPYVQADACLCGEAALPDCQIGNEISYTLDFYENLEPVVFLSYEREAFFAKDGGDFRVTFDKNIRYRREELNLDSEAWGTPMIGSDQVLLELKTSGGIPQWMAHFLSEQGIFKTAFSKYGAAYQNMIIDELKGARKYA